MKIPTLLVVLLVGVLAGALGWHQGSAAMTARRVLLEGESATRAKAVDGAQPRAFEPSQLDSWAGRLAAVRAPDLPALAEEIFALADADFRRRIVRLLCARWAEVDPLGGVAFFAGREKEDPWPRIWILSEWALRDPEAAWAGVATLGEAGKGDSLNVGSELLRESPEIFWVWFQKAHEPLPPSWGDLGPAWLEIAREHATELEALAVELGAVPEDGPAARFSTPKHTGLYALLAAVRAGRDPAAALAWAQSVPDDVRNTCLRQIIPLLAKQDLEAARKALDGMKSKQVSANSFHGSGREQVVELIVAEMGKSNPRAAVEWASRAAGEMSDHITPITNLMKSALAEGRLSPQEAFALIKDQKSDGEVIRLNVLRQMWNGLSAANLAETAGWLKSVDSADAKAKAWALAGLVPEWAKHDRAAALAFANSLEDAGLRQGIAQEILNVRTHFGNSAAGLRESLASIPEADRPAVIKEQVRRDFSDDLIEWGGSEGEFHPTLLTDSLSTAPAGDERDVAMKSVLARWGAVDPVRAVEWAVAQDDPATRTASVMGAMEGWAKHDAWSASQWLAAQPRGPDRDAAAHQLARSLRDQEPDSAWTWTGDIGEPAIRLEARAAVLRKWRDSDAEAARSAVDSLQNLTEPERQKLADTLAHKDQQ